jgi:hypothetical protein
MFAASPQLNCSIARNSTIIIEGRQFWPIIDAADLAPKCSLVSAEAVECEVGQIGETQKATRELDGRIDSRSD